MKLPRFKDWIIHGVSGTSRAGELWFAGSANTQHLTCSPTCPHQEWPWAHKGCQHRRQNYISPKGQNYSKTLLNVEKPRWLLTGNVESSLSGGDREGKAARAAWRADVGAEDLDAGRELHLCLGLLLQSEAAEQEQPCWEQGLGSSVSEPSWPWGHSRNERDALSALPQTNPQK